MKRHNRTILPLTGCSLLPKARALMIQSRRKRTGLLKILFLMLLTTGMARAQNALKATGGTGKYKEDIYWLNFSGISLGQGGSLSRNFTIGNVVVTVQISNVVLGQAGNNLVGYRPGTYQYDQLDNLYNIGGPETANTLTCGLTNANSAGGTSNFFVWSFDLSAYATVNGNPMDLSLIFATAESDIAGEWVRVSTNGSTWQLLEKAVTAPNGLKNIALSNVNFTTQLQCGSDFTTLGAGNAALLYSGKQATSAGNLLVGNVSLSTNGRSAIALGLVLSADFGDAPASYGAPGNIFQRLLSGGNPANTSNHTEYLSAGGSAPAGSIIMDTGTLQVPQFPRLGSLGGDSDTAEQASLMATGDDTKGVDDEDAFANRPPDVDIAGNTYSLSVPVAKNTTTATTPAYVMAWIDFNRNGTFEAAEIATASFTANNVQTAVNLSWNLAGISGKRGGSSFARFRISAADPSNLTDSAQTVFDERSTIVLPGGETEDYSILLIAAPLAVNDSAVTPANTPYNGDVSTNDTCGAGTPCTFALQAGGLPAHGTVTLNTNGTYTYTPNTGYTGKDTFFYTICNSITPQRCDTAIVSIRINIPLPIDLLSFTASPEKDCGLLLRWVSGAERGFDHFDVEWSADGTSFAEVGTIPARGSGSSYVYHFLYGGKGSNFFQLRLSDRDGSYAYSPVIAARLNCAADRDIRVYPTIHSGLVTVEGLQAGELLTVYDMEGRVLLQNRARGPLSRLNLSRTAAGVQTLVLNRQDGRRISYKLQRQ